LATRTGAHGEVTERINLNDAALREAARDRPEGLQLLAEALSNSHPTGRFRELIRLFEQAFAKSGRPLVRLLDAYLSGNPELGYSHGEVANWDKQRNLATHADRSKQFATAADLQPILPRLEVAAYDVLFNKRHWNASDTDRRALWRPNGWVMADGTMVVRQGANATIGSQLIDGFGAYPMHLGAVINPIPDAWWTGKHNESVADGDEAAAPPHGGDRSGCV
jgi:hypothetical protein